ncbi:hypothetical protein [Bacillus sp. FJAT-27245]|uniref:hypothetical protein n=1 Tax=Bacillus sp. FJAT-27245 TaxID=1684144 RepID=UPI0006A76571|nr:hypothetical protein [Bacillus sp. FJAT-27245]
MGKNKVRKLVKISIVLLIFSLLLYPKSTLATPNNYAIDISTSPERVLFDLNNLKPGDRATRTLLIENKGTQNFNYIASGKFNDGSMKYFKELLLKISKGNEVFYYGKLSDFKKLEPRFLSKGSNEELLFSVLIPGELDNDYQGLGCEFQFKFFVEGSFNGTIPPEWVPEPDPPKQEPPKEDPPKPDPPKQDPPKQDPPQKEPPFTQPPGDKEPDVGEGPEHADDEEDGEKPGEPGDTDSEEPPTVELPDNPTPGGTDKDTQAVEIPEETVPIGPGDHLPYTATSIYNLIIIGAGLIGSGVGMQIYFRKRKKLTKNV